MKYLVFTIEVFALSFMAWTIPLDNLVWAAHITCVTQHCDGTSGDDVIKGSNIGEIIRGLTGDDTINAANGDDDVCGGGGNDKINGGNGNDRLMGDTPLCKDEGQPGSDRINGGPGDDILAHGFAWETESDGFKDFLDCGPGDDIALLNITVDHDEAINCEHINPY